jgi:hypothetical protein
MYMNVGIGERGRAVSCLGIFISNFRYSVFAVQNKGNLGNCSVFFIYFSAFYHGPILAHAQVLVPYIQPRGLETTGPIAGLKYTVFRPHGL